MRPIKERTTILAATSYLLLVVAVVLPYGRQLGTRLLGNNIDDWIFYWNNWWMGQVINHQWDWFYTPYLFHPLGTSLASHSNSFLTSILAYPLQFLVGPIAAYNLVLLAGLWVGAWGMFLLVKELTGKAEAAFLAGLVFAFAPYHLSQVLAHAHLGSIHWWPFFALFLRRTLIGGRWLDALAAGFFAALTLWSGLQLAVLLALWSLLYLPWQFWQLRPEEARGRGQWWQWAGRSLSRLAVVGALALLLSWPVVWPTLQAEPDLAQKAAGFDEGDTTQTDLLAYLLPPTYHPLWGTVVEPFYENFVSNRSFMPYLGYSVVGLALLAAAGRRRGAFFWFASGGVWLLLAAGDAPRFNGVVYEAVPLPFRWLGPLFPISAVRIADRFNLLLVFSTAVLVGLGAAWLLERRQSRWPAVLLGALIVLEYLVFPLPAWEPLPDSPFLAQLAADPSPDAVLDYPMGTQPSKLWLYYQTLHGKPLVEGYVGRYGSQTYAYILENSLLRTLRQPEETGEGRPIVDLGPQLRRLRADGIGYLLVHPPFANEAEMAYFRQLLPAIGPVYRDESLVVYDLEEPRPWQYGDPPVALSETAKLLEATAHLEGAALRILVVAELVGEHTGTVECRVELEPAVAAVPLLLFDESAAWQPGDLTVQEVILPLPDMLPPGTYDWQIACRDSLPAVSPDRLVAGENGRLALLRVGDEVTFGEEIRLVGHRRWVADSTLYLDLQWQALADIGRDYKVFVHLLDASGAVVGQYDALHCNWACPSSGWLAGEMIGDTAVLSLWGLPPGRYRLALGLYDPDSGIRLPARTRNGTPIDDGYYVLDGELMEVKN